MFLGQYNYQIENGRVDFPWELPDGKLTWLILEITNGDITTEYCEICDFDEFEIRAASEKCFVEEIRVTSRGELLLDSDGMWQVPLAVREYLKTDEINFVGISSFIEILSAEDMERYEKSLQDSLDLFQELDF